MLSVTEKLSKLRSLVNESDFEQFDHLISSEKFIADLPKRHPELLFLMYKGASNSSSPKYNVSKAEKLLDASANLKHPAALSEKGRIKFESADSPADIMEAEDLFRASINDSAMSRFYIARIYHEGLIIKGNLQKFDHDEAKNQLKYLVESRGDFYIESVRLMAKVILHLKVISENDELFFSTHVGPLANSGDEVAIRLLCIFNVIRLRKSVSLLSLHNDKKLGVDYFDMSTSIKKALSHLEEVSTLITGEHSL